MLCTRLSVANMLSSWPKSSHHICHGSHQSAKKSIKCWRKFKIHEFWILKFLKTLWTTSTSLRRGTIGVDLVQPVMIWAPARCWDWRLWRWLSTVDASQDDAQYKYRTVCSYTRTTWLTWGM